MFKKFLLFVISIVIIFNNFMTVLAVSEPDYYDASERLRNAGVINSRHIDKPYDGLYDKAQITRAEFSAVILNALREEIIPIAEKTYFQDCDIKDWYTPYINKVFELKIVSGYGNDNFMPKNIVTNYEAITMLVRCLGYDDIKTENEIYPYKYLEIAEQLKLLENTSINKAVDEHLTYGNMFMLLLSAMRSNMNNNTQKLWDVGLETSSSYKKVTGKVTSVNNFECVISGDIEYVTEYVVSNDTESIKLIWNYDEDILTYLDKNVSVWFNQSDSENYAIDMIVE